MPALDQPVKQTAREGRARTVGMAYLGAERRNAQHSSLVGCRRPSLPRCDDRPLTTHVCLDALDESRGRFQGLFRDTRLHDEPRIAVQGVQEFAGRQVTAEVNQEQQLRRFARLDCSGGRPPEQN
jgi:hypothetical protein